MSSEPVSAAQVRAARALLAWSQQDLAKHAGVGTSTVADFERGRRTPVANNAQAIRSTLETAGIRFPPGGAVTAPALPPPQPVSFGEPIRWIDTTDLAQWADRRDGQAGLPELISRLIRAQYGHAADLRFPSGDSVQHPGWDGVCQVEEGTNYTPNGCSAWEIGSQRKGIRAKADEDYQKRTANSLGLEKPETTFVFVTPRPWPGKAEWAAARRAEGRWADVRVLDGDDLVHWIELYPSVGHWLAVAIGKRPEGLRQISEVWEEWSLATRPALTPDLILAGRDETAVKILRWLREPASVFPVQAGSVDEAIALLHAAICQLPPEYREPYLARCLVAVTDEAARAVGWSLSPLILIINGGNAGLAQRLAGRGHHVYAAFGSDPDSPTDVHCLPRPRRDQLQEVLQEMGFQRADAYNLARDSGRSLAILRRLIPAAPGRLPTWAVGQPEIALLSALLAGAWDEDCPGDRTVLEELCGEPYQTTAEALVPLASSLDGPVRKSGSAWKLVSPRDAWFLLAQNLTNAHIDRFQEAIAKVLGHPDPRFDLESEERWMAPVTGVAPTYSAFLRRGLTETLILLAIFGHQASGVSQTQERAERIVQDLLTNADERLWWSLSRDFQRLAEAAPPAFLTAVEDSLQLDSAPIMILFDEDDGGIFSDEHLSDLLWALERLAWNPSLLSRVVDVLSNLADADPGGSYSNRPAESLRRIFLPWSPQTYATLDERLRVLDRLRRRNSQQAWTLMMAIAPKGHDSSTPSPHPQWRDYSVDQPEVVTYGLIGKSAQEIGRRLLEDVGTDVDRWTQLIDALSDFDPAWRNTAANQLSDTIGDIVAAEQVKLRVALRKLLNHHRQFRDAQWAMPENELEKIEAIYDKIESTDLVERYAWLFTQRPEVPRPSGSGWAKEEELSRDLRVHAVEAAFDDGGVDTLFRLAEAAEMPGYVGAAIIDSNIPEDQKLAIAARALKGDSPSERNVSHGMVVQSESTSGRAWANALLDRAEKEGWGQEAIGRILLALPQARETWDQVAAAGTQVDNIYWKGVPFLWIRGNSEDIAFAAEKLLGIGRARHAIHLLGHHVKVGLSSELLSRALRAAAEEKPADTDNNEPVMFQHHVAEILKTLDSRSDVSEDDIVQLEWVYFPVLRYSRRPVRTLQNAIAKSPEFFVDVLKAVYAPEKESGVREPEPENLEHANAVASQAWELLHEWNRLPGLGDDGTIDGTLLEAWIRQARVLCARAGRARIGDQKIGEVLASAPTGEDGLWPPIPVREVIEITRSRELDEGFVLGVLNRRGVTRRGPFDGGEQERALAAHYRQWSRALALEWPRTSAALEKIAASYEEDARRFDEQAEQHDW